MRAALTLLAASLCALAVAATGLGCGEGDDAGSATAPAGGGSGPGAGQRFPEIVAVEATPSGTGTYDFAVTISSPYDSPERYANGWRVLSPGGDVLGEMELLHDHASEQPFTRVQSGVEVPERTTEVLIEGRDLENGYGGKPFTVVLSSG
jgi:hypothetical protein